MSDAAATENSAGKADGPKKKGMLIPIIIVVVVLLAGGGGGYFYMQRSKAAEGAEEGEKPAGEKGKAKGKAKAEEADEEPAADEEEGAEEDAPVKKSSTRLTLPDDSKVKHIIELQPYIVNLADTDEPRYLRLAVSLGVGGEEGAEEKPSPLFTTRVRNAMLAVLTSRTSGEVLSDAGKAKLRRDLLRAARAASEEPRVEAVYITEFIVQL
jgi:flagellar FliL protein